MPAEILDFDPDIAVNNVGHFIRPPTSFVDADPSEWARLHDINFGYALRTTHALLPAMIRARRGAVINLTSVEAHRAIPGHTVYSAYKAALMQFTRSVAAEVGHYGVRVNAIAPDLIETPQVPYADLVPREHEHMWERWSPLGGPGQPVDVAGAAVFLASDLSRFTTGTTVHVGGGTEVAGGWFRRGDGGWTNRPLNP
ncbi:short chain dehydrogenase [Gordonia neofelifaecis NRRL B-59395]|uniref:Short chain dehydrogenase n=1 Tax=Gordonia neofelifaecis NRRL B-59395 TaxID=644548 RepID=F1YKT0_9ACTN|nr:short chain dehydrogenase [Gordonia neofelifaecis NRRL B-59395]